MLSIENQKRRAMKRQLSFPFSFTGVSRVRRKGLRNGNTFDRFSFLRPTSSSSEQFNLKTFLAKAPRFSTNNVTKQYPIAAKRNYSNSLLASVYEYYLPLKKNKKKLRNSPVILQFRMPCREMISTSNGIYVVCHRLDNRPHKKMFR